MLLCRYLLWFSSWFLLLFTIISLVTITIHVFFFDYLLKSLFRLLFGVTVVVESCFYSWRCIVVKLISIAANTTNFETIKNHNKNLPVLSVFSLLMPDDQQYLLRFLSKGILYLAGVFILRHEITRACLICCCSVPIDEFVHKTASKYADYNYWKENKHFSFYLV